MNALFYMTKAGCTWRMLFHDLPRWEVVYMYFSRWRDEGVSERIDEVLHRQVRVVEGKDEEPSAAVMDSQGVKTAEKGGLGARLATMLGRRSKDKTVHPVDTMDLLLVVVVHSAGVQDRDAAKQLL